MDFDTIVETLYEGTLDSAAWDRALLSIADAVGASGAILFAFNPSSGALLRDEQHRVDPQVVIDYAKHWNVEDIRKPYAFTLPVGQPGTEVSLAIPLKQSAFYGYLLSVDMPHFMPAWLHKSNCKAVALVLQGTLRRGPFGRAEAERFRSFLPHLARALEIRDRLEAAQVRADRLAGILDTTSFGVLLLAADRRIIECNAVAAALLAGGAGLRRGSDGAVRFDGVADDRLAGWLRGGRFSTVPAEALLRVPRDGRLPLSVLMAPVSKASISWTSNDAHHLLLIFDPERQVPLNTALIVEDLGLSEREARVVALLAAGMSVAGIARRLHVTVHTVRSQLQAAFQKTGCHSQACLVRRVLLGPGAMLAL